jgi:RHH-type proline utilization regulon transcriptional repressor/proline dehydrogenase/delta 1-pyrroline-5-carboxylate dehydrogenase
MFAASIVTGNCTILKPSEQTPVIAKKLFEIFTEAGLPKNVAAFIPGRGEIIGDKLVKDYRTSTIVFTGSKEVGLQLVEVGGITNPKQTHVKRVIAEMGGKNAIVIDSDADIDEAVKGVLHSAFGFQGQKCSACSRAYVVSKTTYEIFSTRVAEALQDLKIGPTSDPGSFIGPVIDKDAKLKIEKYIEIGKSKYSLLASSKVEQELAKRGNFVEPAIFTNVPDESEIMKDEIFGPVLAINQVSTFKEGIDKALSSAYRLTGGIFSRSPANIEYAMHNFKVGNLYINRSCTGALVYRQPFGGAYMSGIGSKAGGPDYLIQFVVPRVITENTMRRGFAPN